MKPTFKSFKNSNKGLFASYDEGILRVIFNEILAVIKSSGEKIFPMDALVRKVNARLSEEKIAVLNADVPIKHVMDFLSPHLGIAEDSFANHADEGRDLLRSVLKAYLDGPLPDVDALFFDIALGFANAKIVSTKEAVLSLSSSEAYRSIPLEALSESVDALFYFFIDRGLIKEES